MEIREKIACLTCKVGFCCGYKFGEVGSACVEQGKLADQILSVLCAEIKGMGLSDEDYEIVNNMTDEDVIGMTMDAQFGRITAIQLAEKIVERCKATSQSTIDKVVKNLEGKE